MEMNTVFLEAEDHIRDFFDILGNTCDELSEVIIVVWKSIVVELFIELHTVQFR